MQIPHIKTLLLITIEPSQRQFCPLTKLITPQLTFNKNREQKFQDIFTKKN